LDEGDTLGWARLTSGKDEIIIITENGQALRFNETKSARWAAGGGVQGIA
jgi:DNA gyrase/topoisomerase IV subunit A